MKEKGIQCLKQSLGIREKIFGKDHPDVAKVLTGLSSSYHFLGDIQMAKKMAQDAVNMLKDANRPPCK